jgi:hypothetical protein
MPIVISGGGNLGRSRGGCREGAHTCKNNDSRFGDACGHKVDELLGRFNKFFMIGKDLFKYFLALPHLLKIS